MACEFTHIDETGRVYEFQSEEEYKDFLKKESYLSEPMENLAKEIEALDERELAQTVENIRTIFRDVKNKLIDYNSLKQNDPIVAEAFNFLRNANTRTLETSLDSAETLLGMIQEYNVLLKRLEQNVMDTLKNPNLSQDEKWLYVNNTFEFSKAIGVINTSIKTFFDKHMHSDNNIIPFISGTLAAVDSIRVKHDAFAIDYLTDWLWDSFGGNIKNGKAFNAKIDQFTNAMNKADKSGRIKDKARFEKQLNSLKGKTLTKESLRDYMVGLKGDSNLYSLWLGSAISNSDPIVASFAKKLQEKLALVRLNFINKVLNPLSVEFEKFSKTRTASKNNLKEFNKGLYEWVTTLEVDRTDPKNPLILRDVKSMQLNKWWDYNYMNERLEWQFKIDEAKAAGDSLKEKDLRKDFNAWKAEHSEQEYIKEYYDILNSLSIEAKDEKERLDNLIMIKQDALTRGYSEELANDLVELDIEKRRLYSKTNIDGSPKEDKALRIAESLSEYSKRVSTLWAEPTAEDHIKAKDAYNKHKEAFEIDLQNKIKTKKWDVETANFIRRRWIANHSYLKYSDEFVNARKEIYDKLGVLLEGSESTSKKLRDELYDIINPFRDKDKTILADLLKDHEVKAVKDIEDRIENINMNTLNKGLTKAERIKKSKIYKKRHEKESGFDFIKRLYAEGFKDDGDFLNSVMKKEQAYESSLSEADVVKNKQIQSLFAELRELQETQFTSNYTVTYDKQFKLFSNAYINEIKDAEEKEKFLKELSNDERLDILIEAFKESQWYIDNHYDKNVYDEELKGYDLVSTPIAIWRIIVPKDSKYILSENPSYSYYNKNVNESFKNPKHKIDPFTGVDMPKEGGSFDKRHPNFNRPGVEPYPKDQGVLDLLPFLTKQYEDMQSNIPMGSKPGWNLPRFEKHASDIVSEGGAFPLWESFKRKFNRNEQDVDEGLGIDLTDEENNLFQFLPVKFKGKIDESLISYDIFGIITKFGHHSMLRDQFNETLPKAKSLFEIVKNSKKIPDIENENRRFGKMLSFFTNIKNEKNNRAKSLEEIIKTVMFGEFEKAATDGIEWNKIVGNVNLVAALNTLAWNIPGSVVNYMSGHIQLLVESSAGKYINNKDYRRGQKLYTKYIGDLLSDMRSFKEGNKSNIGQMLDYWGALQGEFEEQVGDGFRKTLVKESFESFGFGMYLRKAGEHELQTSLWLSMMSKETVLYKGKTMSLLDAYSNLKSEEGSLSISEKEGIIKKSKLENGKIVEDGNWTSKDEVDLMLKIQKVNMDLNGNYAKINKTVAEKYALGKSTFFFRKYLIPFVIRRFGGYNSQRLDILKDGYEEGYYITLWNSILRPMITSPLRFFKNGDGKFKNLTEDDVINLKRAYTELAIIIALTIVLNAIGDDRDELKDHSNATLHLLFLLKKVKSETEQLNPVFGINEIMAIMRSPSIAFAQLGRYRDLTINVYGTLANEEYAYYKKDTLGFWEKGDSKALADALKLIGFNGKTFHPRALIEGFEYGQRAR
jgi:hypothetical protein